MEAWRRTYYCRRTVEDEQAALREAQSGISAPTSRRTGIDQYIR